MFICSYVSGAIHTSSMQTFDWKRPGQEIFPAVLRNDRVMHGFHRNHHVCIYSMFLVGICISGHELNLLLRCLKSVTVTGDASFDGGWVLSLTHGMACSSPLTATQL